MKKIKQILTGVLLIMTLSVFTACGNNGTAPDEVDTTNEIPRTRRVLQMMRSRTQTKMIKIITMPKITQTTMRRTMRI